MSPDVIWEDDTLQLIQPDSPAVPGHVAIIPKQRYTILEMVPDDLIGKMLAFANQISAVLFEAFHAQGTNIIIPNGTPAGQTLPVTSVHILPRSEGDGLELEWKPKSTTQDQLKSVAQSLQPFIEEMFKPQPSTPAKKQQSAPGTLRYDPDNYLFKQLERTP